MFLSALLQAVLTIAPGPCDSGLSTATLNWNAPGEIHVGSPTGPLFASGVGSQTTGKWVTDGMTFYLVGHDGVLAQTVAHLDCHSSLTISPMTACDGTGFDKTVVHWTGSNVDIRVNSPTGPVFASAAGSGDKETGKWVSDGTVFYLQSGDKTLATQTAHFTCNELDIKKQFGAKGDGVSDDYPALRAAADFLSSHSGKTLNFPEGIYRIGRFAYYHPGTTNWTDSVTNQPIDGPRIVWRDSVNTRIQAQGTVVIDVKSDFIHGDDGQGTVRSPIIPFSLDNNTNFSLDGFELRGGIEEATGVASNYPCMGYGIMSRNAHGLKLSNLRIHHFSCDGYVLGHSTYKGDGVDRDVEAVNVDSHHNARNGMSIISVVNASFLRCQFNLNGRTDGAFPPLSPKSGMDIEPEDASVETPFVDNIVFDHCFFMGNLFDAWIVTSYNATTPYPQVRHVSFSGCTVSGPTFINSISGAIVRVE